MKPIAFLSLLATILAGGAVHGRLSGRWTEFVGPGGSPLNAITESIGDWKPGAAIQLDARETAFQTSAVHRTFIHQPTGRSLVVSLTSGRPAVVAVHTPDVCYVGSGFEPTSTARRVTVNDSTLWTCDFQKNDERIRVYWGWSESGVWEAPDAPRWKFARAPVLYKLYVVHMLTPDDALNLSPDSLRIASDLLDTIGQRIRNGE